jgi:hypothetical protein
MTIEKSIHPTLRDNGIAELRTPTLIACTKGIRLHLPRVSCFKKGNIGALGT